MPMNTRSADKKLQCPVKLLILATPSQNLSIKLALSLRRATWVSSKPAVSNRFKGLPSRRKFKKLMFWLAPPPPHTNYPWSGQASTWVSLDIRSKKKTKKMRRDLSSCKSSQNRPQSKKPRRKSRILVSQWGVDICTSETKWEINMWDIKFSKKQMSMKRLKSKATK